MGSTSNCNVGYLTKFMIVIHCTACSLHTAFLIVPVCPMVRPLIVDFKLQVSERTAHYSLIQTIILVA